MVPALYSHCHYQVFYSPTPSSKLLGAGLVHDLGHGPYSHVFDRFMTRMNRDWCVGHPQPLVLCNM